LCEYPEKSEKSIKKNNLYNYDIVLPEDFGENFDMCFLQDATPEF
jgi:hypothetical protein